MFSVLLSLLCLQRNYSIDGVISSEFLSDYWFDSNGSFVFEFNAPEPISGVWTILASSDELRDQDLKNIKRICRQTAVLNRTFHFTKTVNGRFDRWSGKVISEGLYTPVILNCKGKAFSVRATFVNNNNCLDKRQQFLPYLYAGLSVAYSTLALAWVVNGIVMRTFHVKCHTMFTIVCSFRAVELWLMASLWSNMIVVHHAVWLEALLALVCSVASRALLLTINAAVSGGWGILSFHFEWQWIFASSVTFFALRELAAAIDSILWIVPAIIALNYGFRYFSHISRNILGILAILETVEDDPIALQKCVLCVRFNKELLLWLLCSLILLPLAFSPAAFWESFRRALEELLYLSLVVTDIKYFWYRDSYKGEIREEHEEASLLNISEPDQSYTAFITNDDL